MALTNLAILATQNKRPSPESITSDVAHTHLLPKFPVRVSRVKSYLWMVTVVRMVSPFHINNLPVAVGKMSMATVVSPFRINSLQAIGRMRAINLDAKSARLPMSYRLDPEIWSDLYEERAAHRQFDGGYPRIEAELLARRDIEWRWHLAHRERASST